MAYGCGLARILRYPRLFFGWRFHRDHVGQGKQKTWRLFRVLGITGYYRVYRNYNWIYRAYREYNHHFVYLTGSLSYWGRHPVGIARKSWHKDPNWTTRIQWKVSDGFFFRGSWLIWFPLFWGGSNDWSSLIPLAPLDLVGFEYLCNPKLVLPGQVTTILCLAVTVAHSGNIRNETM